MFNAFSGIALVRYVVKGEFLCIIILRVTVDCDEKNISAERLVKHIYAIIE